MELDVSEVVSWLVVAAVLALIPLLPVAGEAVRRRLSPHVVRLFERAVAALQPEDEPDPFLEAVRAQMRREKLVADVTRLRRLLAEDMAMSATRQLGNRIAYASLVAELEALRDVSTGRGDIPTGWGAVAVGLPSAASVPGSRWVDELVLSTPVAFRSRDDGQRPPAVEVLELGARRRTAS
jgi:hypothetical protein